MRENGIILQTLIKVDSTSSKLGAVKSTKLEIEIPQIEKAQLKKVNVIANSILGIDGKKQEVPEFSKENWEIINGILTINKENQSNLIKEKIVNKDNTLLEENEKVQEVEKYFSESGTDEYLVTYIFENVENKNQTLKSNVKSIITTFGKQDLENKAEKNFIYKVSEQIGNIVDYQVQNETKSISKVYTYINYNKEDNLYENEYKTKEIINISYKDIVQEIYIKDLSNKYVDKNKEQYELSDIYYKAISVSKLNFDEILGNDGIIEIENQDGNQIAKFTKDTKPNENGNLVYNFNEYTTNNITIKISKPELEGNLIFDISKVQKQTSYDKSEFATFDYIETNSKAETKYINAEDLVYSGEGKTKIKLEDTKTKADLEINKFSILDSVQTIAEMKIKLNNQDINSDIYGSSIFEITFPKNIEDLEIIDYNILYGEGLELKNIEKIYTEEGRLALKITIEGIQKDLSPGSFTNGTNIIFNSIIKEKKVTPLVEKDIEFKVTNSESTNYENEGICKVNIPNSTQTGIISIAQCNENQNETILEIEDKTKNFDIEKNKKLDNNSNEEVEKKSIIECGNFEDVQRRYKITGCVWLDSNLNGLREQNEEKIESAKVILVDSKKGSIKNIVETDSKGTYEFKDLENGDYFIVFEYDSGQYKLTTYQKKDISFNNNSDVISTQIEQGGKIQDKAITDVIIINNSDVSNIDMGLVQKDIFDLQLTETVSKITIKNKSGITTSEYNNLELAKIEIAKKDIESSIADIEYTIVVENKGDVQGYVKKIVDYIPEDLTFNSSINPDWYIGNDGNLYTNSLTDKVLDTGQKEEIKLILTKKLTKENIGMINNTSEIVEDYNVYGLKDINSKVGNKVEAENDFGSANVIISVKTGEVFIYISVILTTTLLGGIAMFIIISKLKIKKRKEGGV